jgi:HK97 family phage major capsid protein
MTLEQLRALLREKHAGLKTLREKAFGEGGTDEDLGAFEKAVEQCEALEKKIDLLEREEAVAAKASVPAANPTGDVPGIGHNSGAVPAAVKEADGEQVLALTAAAIVKGKATGAHPLKVLENEGYGKLASDLSQKAVNTLVSAEGGILVPQAQVGGIVPLLRQQATFLAAGPTRVPLVNGQYKTARGASGASAAYVGEGGLKPISTPTFDAIDMRSRKLAGIVPMTEESRMWTIGDIEGYVRDDLRNALAMTLDLNAWLGTGAGTSPVGILNKAGVQVLDLTGLFADPTAPTLAELDRFASAMILRLTTAGIVASGRWCWVMSFRSAMYLQDMRVGDNDGAAAFPGMQNVGAGGQLTWKGFPVVVTAQLPTNGGATTDESQIALVDFAHVLFGEEMDIRMRMSDQATLDPDGSGANLIHLWQQNMYAILAESMHDFGLRLSKAVVKALGIRF